MTSTTPNTENAAHVADVDAHVPVTERVETIDGREFKFRPLRVRQFFPFLALARPLFAALAKASSPPAPGLPPAPADGQGGESIEAARAVDVPALPAMIGESEAILELLENDGPTAIRALAVGLELDQAPEVQEAMYQRLSDLTMVGLLVAFKHFVVINADFFAAQGLRLPQGGLLGARLAPAASVGVRTPASAARPRRKR